MGLNFKKWKIASANSDFAKQFSNEYGINPLVAEIMSARGCDSFEKAEEFLFSEGQLTSPFFLKDMDKAVSIIHEAIDNNELIVIYGDYDCDGITSTAVLTKYLSDIGANVSYYIPPRSKGYGLNADSLKKLKDKGVNLVITVDNGISAIEEIDFANSIDLKVIVTDHHTPLDILPNALAVVNPHRIDCLSSCKNISGVGVALKLISALEDDYEGSETLYTYGAFAAIGTIADIVELSGENREIVRAGIERLREGWILGISYLCEKAGLDEENLTSTDIAFMLAPRINASGRVGKTHKAVELLLTEDEAEALALSEEINNYNVVRKEIEQQILTEAEQIISDNPKLLMQRVLVVSGKNWHNGVTGIVCARLVEKYSKPCIVFSIENGEARGTCRSVEGYNVIESIFRCKKLLKRYGGHNQAAGVTLDEENLDEFIKELEKDAAKYYDIMPIPTVKIDCMVDASRLTTENIDALEILQPCGAGNSVPVFAIEGAKIEAVIPLSSGRHTKVKLSNNSKNFFVLCFGVCTSSFPYSKGKKVDVVFTASINNYNGNRNVTLKLKDIRSSGLNEKDIHIGGQLYEKLIRGESLESCVDLVPTRLEMAELYRYIRRVGTVINEPIIIFEELGKLSYFKIKVLINILIELKLVYENDAGRLTIVPNPHKTDMDISKILQKLKSLV